LAEPITSGLSRKRSSSRASGTTITSFWVMAWAQKDASRLMSTVPMPVLAAKKTWSLPIMFTAATGVPNMRAAILTTGSREGSGLELPRP
jgi:hypothetical protein